MQELDELKKTANTLRELGEDWKENIAIVNETSKGNKDISESIRRLCKEGNQGNLVKIGLTLLAFPLPIVIDDILGSSFLVAGLIQMKIKNSALYLEDLNKEFPSVLKELQEARQAIIQP